LAGGAVYVSAIPNQRTQPKVHSSKARSWHVVESGAASTYDAGRQRNHPPKAQIRTAWTSPAPEFFDFAPIPLKAWRAMLVRASGDFSLIQTASVR